MTSLCDLAYNQVEYLDTEQKDLDMVQHDL